MSLLDHLWDETLAGPPPENGLGKLRKPSTFIFRSSKSANESQPVTNNLAVEDPAMRVKPPASSDGSTPPEADQRRLGFVRSLYRTVSRRQPGLDAGDLVLLTTCDM